jgi:hypothetical protein
VRPRRRYFQLTATVERTAVEIPKKKGAGQLPADAAACLQNNTEFAARNPQTAKLAQELKAHDPVHTVENIRKWIKENMVYT